MYVLVVEQSVVEVTLKSIQLQYDAAVTIIVTAITVLWHCKYNCDSALIVTADHVVTSDSMIP